MQNTLIEENNLFELTEFCQIKCQPVTLPEVAMASVGAPHRFSTLVAMAPHRLTTSESPTDLALTRKQDQMLVGLIPLDVTYRCL